MKKLSLLLAMLGIVSMAQSQSWSLSGNSGTGPGNFLGTTDNVPFRLRVANIQSGFLDSVSSNTAFGFRNLGLTTGYYNSAFGYKALVNTTSGNGNTGVGMQSLFYNTTGSWNTASGYLTLYRNTSGFSNSAFGAGALSANTTGLQNTAVGDGTLLNNTTGFYNTAIGAGAIQTNTVGNYNTGVGLFSLSHGGGSLSSYNTAVGAYALQFTTNSQGNTAIGYNAGRNNDNGYYNVFVGANTDVNGIGYYNVIAIGQGTVVNGPSVARFGNGATVSYGGWANWTNVSDGRLKKDVKENVSGLSFIMKLRPVTYHLALTEFSKQKKENGGNEWDAKMQTALKEKEQIVYSGFIAQEVEKAAQESGYDFSGVDKPKNSEDLYGLRYAEFVVPLVKAVQEQEQLIEQLQKKIADLETKLNGSQSGNTNDVFSVWPNPSNDHFMINIGSTVESQVVIKVFDSKGGLVKEQKMAVTTGNNPLQFDTKSWTSGIYLFSAEWNNGKIKKTMQVVKQ